MSTLGVIDLGLVKSESSTKDSNLFFFPIPRKDSDEAFLIDLMGTSRTITISGEFIGTPGANKLKVEEIEAIQNGQQESVTFTGEVITAEVQIQSFNWDYVAGDPNRISYTLTLLEGS